MKLKAKALLLCTALVAAVTTNAQTPVYLDESKPVDQRIEDALQRMTLQEKINIIHAQSKFSSPGVARLGIPEVWTDDGPHGVRPDVFWDEWNQAGCTNDSCLAFPALTCLAATWNPDMSRIYGVSLGEEARYRNKSMILGPGVCIFRTPYNGRNFEYLGEDPYLASVMVVPYIQGMQSVGVSACVKHYALNNQEFNRHTTNVKVSDRALYEIYLPAFKAAVQEGKTWAIMGSYNLYNNQHCCHNDVLLNKILKGEWGYDGVVVSDWGGTHNTEEAIHNGLDMEFGSWTDGLRSGTKNAYENYYLARPYYDLIKEGKVGTKELDDKVRRVLRLIFRTSMNRNRPFGSFVSEAHIEAARTIAEQGIVLLKNEGDILPIDVNKAKKVLIVGENAIKMMTVGGGSSSLKVKYELSPLDGIRNRLAGKSEVVYQRGYVGDAGDKFDGVSTGQDLSEKRSSEELLNDAVEAAKAADYVIYIGGLNKAPHQDCEDADRETLSLPYNQDKVIEALAAANKNFVVVNISGTAVAMPWVKNVPAIVQAWYLGSEAGNALAAVLTGDVNPSGKLPFTFPAKIEDVGAHSFGPEAYPGIKRNDDSGIWDEEYKEDIFVGYRWVDKEKTKPLFPFGYGLSYTTFDYGKAKADKAKMSANGTITISVPVTNSGSRDGQEIVQLYISDLKSSLPRPVKELKAFKKVNVPAGKTVTVDFTIDKGALSFFDPEKHDWVAEPGKFEALIAASSADIRSKVSFELE